MKKGEIYDGIVTAVDYPNRGLVCIEDQAVIVKNAIPGQKVRLQIQKKRSGRAEGRLLEVLEKSPLETRPAACSLFPDCGGCMYQTMDYQAQLSMKEGQIYRLLSPFLTENAVWEGIFPSPAEWHYRNKMEFSFGDEYKDGPLTLGLHKKGSTYDILNVTDCALVHPDMNRILDCVGRYFREWKAPYYHKLRHEGYLRHLLIRRAVTTGEILVHVITTSQAQYPMEPLVRELLELPLEGKIVGILHLVNDSLADVVRADRSILLWGKDYFYETLLGLKFRISTFSFFQPNSLAAEVLYGRVRAYVQEQLRGGEVFDLYSGTGTIAQILSPMAKSVTGIEIVEEAVEAARQNAGLNGLENCRFIAGDVLKVLDELDEKPDLIVLDPPRDGIHPKALPKILAYGVPNIVYISCKATSLARDLPAFIQAGYRIERACCVDQFCETPHVETVCLLGRQIDR